MKIIIEGEVKEIAALVNNFRAQQEEVVMCSAREYSGKALARLWEKQGFSRRTLSEKMGVDQSLIELWESGEEIPNAQRCIQMADILKIPLFDIYFSLITG